MERYNLETCDPYDMEPSAHGMWVMFDDVQAVIDAAVAAERERWEAQALALFAADDAYGCGFYNGLKWQQHYAELRRMCAQQPATQGE